MVGRALNAEGGTVDEILAILDVIKHKKFILRYCVAVGAKNEIAILENEIAELNAEIELLRGEFGIE